MAAFERAAGLKTSERVQAIPHALSLSALGRHDEAIDILRLLQARKRRDYELANLLGVVLKRAGRFTQALRMFDLARGLRPGNVAAWVNMGNTHEMMADFKAAADAFGQAARLKPTDAEVWRLHGLALFRQGRHDEACIVARLAGRPDLLRFGSVPDRPCEPQWMVADTRRLRREAGYRAALILSPICGACCQVMEGARSMIERVRLSRRYVGL